MTWLLARQHTPIELPEERLPPSEAIIISKAGLTEEAWKRLTPAERADYRWRIGLGANS